MLPQEPAEVAALRDELRVYGHRANPFLDANYSLGGYYPVTDFTSTVARWLREGSEVAIEALWRQITRDTEADQVMLRTAMSANLDPKFRMGEEDVVEVKAVHLLGSRLSVYENTRHAAPFAMARVLGTWLASSEWRPPVELLPDLRQGAETEVQIIPGFHPPERKRVLADQAMAALSAPQDESDKKLGAWMRCIPPMARLVIAEYFNMERGRLRPELFYGDRKYGSCAKINLQWIDWVGCFDTPVDDIAVPHAMTKAYLLNALHSRGVRTEKSWPKDKLINEARRYPGLISAVFSQHLPDFRIPRPEWELPLRRWSNRCDALRPVALAILKDLENQSAQRRREMGVQVGWEKVMEPPLKDVPPASSETAAQAEAKYQKLSDDLKASLVRGLTALPDDFLL